MKATAIIAASLLATSLAGASAGAVAAASAVPSDPRIRVVTYTPSEVVGIQGHYGYQILIAFAPEERIGNISIGDSTAWAVTPNKEANGLFLKPVEARAATNMTVQTDRRTYLFELVASRATRGGATAGMLYKLQFRYPEPATPTPPPVVAYNRAYKISGARAVRPTQVFDDGRSTFFLWPAQATVPAIFTIAGHQEELVNPSVRGGYVVVDRVAAAFVLRAGRETVRVANQAIEANAGKLGGGQ